MTRHLHPPVGAQWRRGLILHGRAPHRGEGKESYDHLQIMHPLDHLGHLPLGLPQADDEMDSHVARISRLSE